MIHSKLKKGKTEELLVQFSRNTQEWPLVVQKFYDTCKDENVRINKSPNLKPQMIRFYTVQQKLPDQSSPLQKQSVMDFSKMIKSQISSINLEMTVIYVNSESFQLPQYSTFTSQTCSFPRVLLLRECLEDFYSLDFQVENTLSEQDSIIYLCDLAAMIINCKNLGQIELFDQKKERMIRKGNQGQMTELQVMWRNLLFQVPGLGKDKCKLIADKYPTYQALLKDCDKEKQLKNLAVERGTKSIKIGGNIAERIYKVFGSINGKESLY